MKPISLSDRLHSLSEKGVQLVDPRQVFIDEDVSLERIHPGSVLFPGTRISGANTLVAPGAKIGSEGPATIVDSAIGENAEVASGFVAGTVLLNKARIGSNGHIRAGTLLEEEASTAHAVGLKHTILTSFVTLGSLINCCDCLISGGRSRANHTEIGSGFIHFNFTPWGDNGDKATPSLIGGVPRGVFLREERIFIGGLSGMVGPTHTGFGSFTVAGQIMRSDVGDNRVHSEVARKIDGPWDFKQRGLTEPRAERNLEYIGHLAALRAWYADVRKPLLSPEQMSSHIGQTLDAAIGVLDSGITERTIRLQQFLSARNVALPPLRFPATACPLKMTPQTKSHDHISWVRSLSDHEVRLGTDWLQEIVETFVRTNRIA
jgi:UDP-N-acetylglucosamine/UDP-N-acetylgalactosamine diphosphorylase